MTIDKINGRTLGAWKRLEADHCQPSILVTILSLELSSPKSVLNHFAKSKPLTCIPWYGYNMQPAGADAVTIYCTLLFGST